MRQETERIPSFAGYSLLNTLIKRQLVDLTIFAQPHRMPPHAENADLLGARIMYGRDVDLGARGQTIANDSFSGTRPLGYDHRQLLVVVVQAPQSMDVAMQAGRFGTRTEVDNMYIHMCNEFFEDGCRAR